MRRFYETVTVEGLDGTANFAVLLDQKPVTTPARQPLQLTSADLAEAIAHEWEAQSETIDVRSMPLTQMAATAIDRVTPDVPGYVGQIAAFGETDLICYRTPHTRALETRQQQVWQPLVDWAAETLQAPLEVTNGVAPVGQSSQALGAIRAAVEAHDAFELAALGLATTASGSVVIALALSHGEIEAEAAFTAAFLDEMWQVEQWGSDEDADVRQQNARGDIEVAARFLSLHRSGRLV